MTPAPAPLFVPDSDRLREQALRHGGLLHLQPTDGRPHACGRWRVFRGAPPTVTFIADSLPTLRSQRPPVAMQRPSPHRPSEHAPANAVLLLQPLSTDSACQLLENTLLSTVCTRRQDLRSGRCWHLSDDLSPGSSFLSSLCSSSSDSRSSMWVAVARDIRLHIVSCDITEEA